VDLAEVVLSFFSAAVDVFALGIFRSTALGLCAHNVMGNGNSKKKKKMCVPYLGSLGNRLGANRMYAKKR